MEIKKKQRIASNQCASTVLSQSDETYA